MPLLRSLIVLLVLLASPSPAQWAGEWKLDETTGTTAADSSGNANDGTLVNFGPSPWVKGKFGNALTFDGVDDYVDINLKKNLPVYNGLGSPYTVAFWVKAPGQDDKRTYAEGHSQAGIGQGALLTLGTGRNSNSTTDKFQIYIRNDAGTVVCNGYSNAVVFDDTWHHVCWVDVSGETTLYVDGVKDTGNFNYTAGREPGTTGFGSFTVNRASIGSVLRQSACCLLRGMLDDVRVYNFAVNATDLNLIILGVPTTPCRSSVGKYGQRCAGNLDIASTGTAQFGQQLSIQLSGGTPNAAAFLLIGTPVNPLDISLAGFTGCVIYPSMVGSLLAGIGNLDTAGTSPSVPIPIPTTTSLTCQIGVIQGVAISGSKLELSRAILAQIGN